MSKMGIDEDFIVGNSEPIEKEEEDEEGQQ